MRYIDVQSIQPPPEWLAKAETLSRLLDGAATKAERDKIIDDNAGLWGELKPWLLEQSRRKCWFSEARDSYSHWDVEHYRPKKSAKDLNGAERDGYWWLTFSWRNFRICGNVGNRKKGTFFPLRQGTHCADATNRNVDDEFPLLLDPTRLDDVVLLCFDENGDVNPLPNLDEWSTLRVDESIKRYKLRDHEPLMEARRDVWSRCTREINRCQHLMDELSKAPTATKKQEVQQQMIKLKEMLLFDAEFSAAACDCLRTRSEHWAQRLVMHSYASPGGPVAA